MTNTTSDFQNDNTDAGEPPTLNRALATSERFAAQLLRLSIDALANQRTLWPVTPQQQQQEVIDRLRNGFTEVILRQIPQIAAAGFVHAEVSLQTITAKGDAIKAVVTIGDNKTLHDLVDVMGRKVVLVLVDAEVYTAGMESFEAQADQPDFGFGAPQEEAA